MAEVLMEGEGNEIGGLVLVFAVLSVFSIGGLGVLFPEVQRQAVDVQGWMPVERLRDLFAIARAAPGPGMLLVPLIGFNVASVPGAILATLAYVGPSSIICFAGNHMVENARSLRIRYVLQNAFVPISLGMFAAAAVSIAMFSVTSWLSAAVVAMAIPLGLMRRVHPIAPLIIGAVVGYLFLR
jgi:chromate transporter